MFFSPEWDSFLLFPFSLDVEDLVTLISNRVPLYLNSVCTKFSSDCNKFFFFFFLAQVNNIP